MEQNNGTKKNLNPNIMVLGQYIKDLSFESPNSPNSLQKHEKSPNINITVNVNANPLINNDFDVVLSLNAEAKDEEKILFNIELAYGGVFRITDFPQEHILPVLLIECPRLLFPFVRQIIADVTRDGAFHPLMIDPIDFSQIYTQKILEEKSLNTKNNTSH
ncbi:Protein export cytoplasm chaperone protein SecB [Liberibacter crescens BT-1]|uniref:Protein-export protein SecB n=1 Tax=Liberibacter crescens (strain BT-1) TaxID=1215343 RepID=L0EXH4_LIBCB|nr:protein-export chaperone SecB [Liberibacter crescens]AGA65363.1 Protein export cytoplasm chaperone protein SecB [Liberibacter crescens BT-1]AMC12301.1 preprotein translocase subunit SecB [Liberibacter crescens]